MLGFIIVYEAMEAIIRKGSLVDAMMFCFSHLIIVKILLILSWVSKIYFKIGYVR